VCMGTVGISTGKRLIRRNDGPNTERCLRMSDIVPEGFDLESAKAAITKSRADEAERCKECGHSGLEPRSGGMQNKRAEVMWYCPYCQEQRGESDTYHGTYDDVNG
jgi:hypothetical protein